MDDPLVGLDFKLREQMFDDLKQMQQTLSATFLYTTSDPLEALALDDQIENKVWVECPLDWITLFGPNGRRLQATLTV